MSAFATLESSRAENDPTRAISAILFVMLAIIAISRSSCRIPRIGPQFLGRPVRGRFQGAPGISAGDVLRVHDPFADF